MRTPKCPDGRQNLNTRDEPGKLAPLTPSTPWTALDGLAGQHTRRGRTTDGSTR
ncbi:hypothetical protein SCATT_25410 [Streptantibioticus cattleyicolor NRRL 8057 = DSM 46488]|uniref:Uncharacterized protein n=1 Tax=Streptantibioticus cattleyicolor (strain ATCC 35852 / DSM 46488 / JCM 4925 / NBRC 14057 / NRRL 8057) TaxID=1003195 RepID=G8WWM6_STREN|nr:hypothetical protein SCATT_25410 [Streptantibioticus cattleyicolor NRRL 8057 = DSM 46488]